MKYIAHSIWLVGNTSETMEFTMWLEIFNEMTHLENVFIHFHMNAMHIQRQIRFATEYVHVYM